MADRLSLRFLQLMILAMGILPTSAAPAPQQEVAVEPPPLDRPLIFDSSTRGSGGNKIPGPKFRVVPMRGFSYPYALAFLPDGSILVTERAGRLRIVRDGKLDPQPIAGIPDVLNTRQRGMNDLALHPRFAENHWIYFTYYKPVAGTTNARATLARARYDGGHMLSDVRDIFSTDSVVSGPSAAKIAFGRDGKIYMAIGIPIPRAANDTASATVTDAQDPYSYYGKVLRLNDDGSAPMDNPFSDRPGHKPEALCPGHSQCHGPLRRRNQHHQGWKELRLACDFVRPRIHGRPHRRDRSCFGSALRPWHGTAVALLVSLDLDRRHHVLYREPVSRLEGQHLRGWTGQAAGLVLFMYPSKPPAKVTIALGFLRDPIIQLF